MSLSNILKSASSSGKRLIELKTFAVERVPVEGPSFEKTADDILTEAKLESERLKQEAISERDAVLLNLQKEKESWVRERERERAKAKEEGYEAGHLKGYEEGKNTWIEQLNAAKAIVFAAERDYKKTIATSEATLLNLSVAIAGRIISKVLENEPESFITLVKKAIQEVRDQESIKIMVAPSRFTSVLENKEELQAISHDAIIQIFPDETLSDDSCLIETPFGRIDASVDQQLSIIKRTLKEILEASSDEDRGAL